MRFEDLACEDVAGLVAPEAYARGERCWREGRVVISTPRHERDVAIVAGRVRDGGAAEHSVYAQLAAAGRGRLDLEGDCTCPASHNCEHVVALLLHAIARRASGATDPAPARGVEDWAARMARAARLDTQPRWGDVGMLRLAYVLEAGAGGELRVRPLTVRLGPRGTPDAATPFSARRALEAFRPPHLSAVDIEVLCALAPEPGPGARRRDPDVWPLGDARVLEAMVETGRCHWGDHRRPTLELGPPRAAAASWRLEDDGAQRLRLAVPGDAILTLATDPPWYVDRERRRCGPAASGLAAAAEALIAAGVHVRGDALGEPPGELACTLEALGLPPPRRLERVAGPPVPQLELLRGEADARARLGFVYAGVPLPAGDDRAAVVRPLGDRLARIERDLEAELACIERLGGCGFAWPHAVRGSELEMDMVPGGTPAPVAWLRFVRDDVPRLRAEGWAVRGLEGLDDRVRVPEAWFAEVDEGEGGWFDLGVGIVIEGERIALLPLLHDWLMRLPAGSRGEDALAPGDGDDEVLIQDDDGRWIGLPRRRVAAIVRALIELNDPELRLRGKRARLPRWQAARIVGADIGVPWAGDGRLLALAERLEREGGITAQPEPPGFGAALRPYQAYGLGWLDFLRELGAGGILADEMGLGKTVQVLAHLVAEQRAGRLAGPSLVIAPTSVLGVWRHEAARFAPSLALLVLHGPERRRRFAEIAAHDLVVTSYALARRDRAVLERFRFHLLVLDEAQAVKNPRAKFSHAVHALRAERRIGLTGTPLENSLDDLWSLLACLEPGLLGGYRQFTRLFRRPIEELGDAGRRAVLRRRVAPFILRRRKDAVLDDLPEKTEIEHFVELLPDQRDLYEVVRVSVRREVEHVLTAKGLAAGHIHLLDALLKLRQVCCDPRLVKLDEARQVRGSAKLDAITEMVPEMVREGRRVLVFSQFTSMLRLIEAALADAGLPTVKLVGATRDRETPIARFQAGEVPVFLISLKAGGTGLTLTAADTVIHYDPWWNPAVEAQATDRAHRLGQRRNVFVYKLVAADTLEQRILELQAAKRELVGGILGTAGRAGAPLLTRADLEHLLAPLP